MEAAPAEGAAPAEEGKEDVKVSQVNVAQPAPAAAAAALEAPKEVV